MFEVNTDFLRRLLIELSGNRDMDIPDAARLGELLKANKADFFRHIPIIVLPPITNISSSEIEELNRAILQVVRSA